MEEAVNLIVGTGTLRQMADNLAQKREADANPEPENEEAAEDLEVEEAESDLEDTEGLEEEESPEEYEDETDGDVEYEAEEGDEELEYYTVKIDGKEEQVTLEELQNGYQKDADYRKKTAEVAEQRKALEAELEKVKDLPNIRQKLLEEYEILEQINSAPLLTDEQLKKIREEHGTDAYLDAKEAAEKQKQRLQAIRQKKEAIQSELTEDQKKEHQALLKREQAALLGVFPELASDERQTQLVSYITQDLGFDEETVNSIVDHRVFTMAEKARLWDESQKRKPKKTSAVPKVTKKKSARKDSSALAAEKIATLKKRAMQTGKPQDIAAYTTAKRNLKGD